MRKISLLLIFILIFSIFVGCASTQDLPEGFKNADFYNDSMKYVKLVVEDLDKGNSVASNKFFKDVILEKYNTYDYYDNNLSDKGRKLFDNISMINFYMLTYFESSDYIKDGLMEELRKFVKITDMDIDKYNELFEDLL